jgi:toxin ParE1/3/4
VPGPSFTLDLPVDEELWEIWDYIDRRDAEAAMRVIKAAHETFAFLARNSGVGKRCGFQGSRLSDVYFRPVMGFENYLIFYRITKEGVHILHVLHKARNVEKVFRKR